MSCGCECGCCAACVSGDCWGACCVCPTPTCGCGEPLSTGEYCLNQSYYLVATNSQTGQQAYFQFSFGYCILTSLTGTSFSSATECIAQWISIYYELDISNLWVYNYTTGSFPTGIPMATETGSGSSITGYGYATNSFLWAIDVEYYQTNPFTPYCGSSSAYPQGVYPQSSTN